MYHCSLGPGQPIELKSCPNYMRIPEDIRKTVVFIGYGSPTDPDDFTPIGTGFLVGYRDLAHLVTVKHIALDLGDDPFDIRMNKPDGGSGILHVEGTEQSRMAWHF